MTLRQWQDNGWLRPHATTAEEIGNLLAIVDRDLQDAQGGISPDWRFGIAYNAALKLCTILLYAEGYRPERTLQHFRTIQALPLILGAGAKNRRGVPRYVSDAAEPCGVRLRWRRFGG